MPSRTGVCALARAPPYRVERATRSGRSRATQEPTRREKRRRTARTSRPWARQASDSCRETPARFARGSAGKRKNGVEILRFAEEISVYQILNFIFEVSELSRKRIQKKQRSLWREWNSRLLLFDQGSALGSVPRVLRRKCQGPGGPLIGQLYSPGTPEMSLQRPSAKAVQKSASAWWRGTN